MSQKARARRRVLPLVALGSAALVAAGVVQLTGDDGPAALEPGRIGVPAADAGAGPVLTEETSGSGEHVEGRVSYERLPPSSGPHGRFYVKVTDRGFYTTRDAPPVEELVHNLEHGYTVLWYDPALSDREKENVEQLARSLRKDQRYAKFIAAPWDTSRGPLPDGKPLALTHWGVDNGYRQYLTSVSGEAVAAFLDAHPASDSPEPAGP